MSFPSFEECEPILWQVVSKLARRGFVLPPDEAREGIQEFFAEEWAGLRERFTPSRGQADAYVYVAFYRFLQRYTLRSQDWRSRLRDVRELLDRPGRLPDPADDAAVREEITRVRAAIRQLPERDHRVLASFLFAGHTSERALAKEHGLTRHAVRGVLVDCFGRLARQLLRTAPDSVLDRLAASQWPPSPDEVEYLAVLATWGEGRSAGAAAAVLGVTEAQVRAAQQRYVYNLISTLRHPSPPKAGGTTRNVPMATPPLELLKRALFAVRDEALLAEVKGRAGEIDRALEEQDIEFSDEEGRRLEAYPAWTAAVFHALSGSSEEEAAGSAVAVAIQRAQADEEGKMAQAFVAAVTTLPAEFSRWNDRFGKLPEAAEWYREELEESRVFELAGGHARGLARYGLSPVSFFEAARGVQLLADRLIDAASADDPARRQDDDPVIEARSRARPAELPPEVRKLHRAIREQRRPAVGIDLGSDRHPWPMVPIDLALAAVRGAVHGPPQADRPLLRWLVEAAALRPDIFAGYEAEPLGPRAVLLRPEAGRTDHDLVRRWGQPPDRRPNRKPVPVR